MYCSSCGVAVGQGLSYCNYCGANLAAANGDDLPKSSDVKSGSLIAAIVAVFVLGLGVIVMMMGMMKAVLRLDSVVILAFVLLSFLIMLSIEVVFVRLLLTRKRDPQPAVNMSQMPGQTTRELDASQMRVLNEPMASVTENPTRTFEPVNRKRSS